MAAAETRRRGQYGPLVRELFYSAVHGGDLPDGEGRIVRSQVSEGSAGPQICLSARTDGAVWLAIRYRVFGCPHLVAAAEWSAERFEGGAVESVQAFPVDEILDTLDVPIEKTGRILLLEDAFMALDGRRRAGLD